MKSLVKTIIALLLLYVCSYWLFRTTHMETWAQDGQDYIIFPENRNAYNFFRPLAIADEKLTGAFFHIGSHGDTIVRFNKTGVLARNSAGLKPNVWYLIYEDQGDPTRIIELIFSAGVQTSKLYQGDRVAVTGTKNGSSVLVTSMTKQEVNIFK